MVVVAGPRIDPASAADADGLEVRRLRRATCYRQLAACDVAVVQGGLTTTMELVAARTPFVCFPLASHFEQQLHVRHRLDRYGARHAARVRRRDARSGLPRRSGRAPHAAKHAGELPAVPAGGAALAAALIAELLPR